MKSRIEEDLQEILVIPGRIEAFVFDTELFGLAASIRRMSSGGLPAGCGGRLLGVRGERACCGESWSNVVYCRVNRNGNGNSICSIAGRLSRSEFKSCVLVIQRNPLTNKMFIRPAESLAGQF